LTGHYVYYELGNVVIVKLNRAYECRFIFLLIILVAVYRKYLLKTV